MHSRGAPPLPPDVRDLRPEEARGLIEAGQVRVLDVREPAEFIAGHIPGALLVPLNRLPDRLEELDPDQSWLIHCAHGIRSVQAATLLEARGFGNLYHLSGGIVGWKGPLENHTELFADASSLQPNDWVVQHLALAPPGRALDVACGSGRHALALAWFGWQVDAVDRDAARLESLDARANALNFPVTTWHLDLEDPSTEDPLPGSGPWELVVVVHYLHRPLFSALRRAVRPGGVLLYETFLDSQAELEEGPSNPDHLLDPGELERTFRGWEVLDRREGEAPPDGSHRRRRVASLAVRRPVASGGGGGG